MASGLIRTIAAGSRVLVTGSAGRIGRAIWIALVRAGYSVRGLDTTPASTVECITDLRDHRALAAACAGIDAIVHTAALHAPHVGVRSDADFQAINVDATRALCDAAASAGVRRIVYTSTTALYGNAATPEGRAGWVDEDTDPEPVTVYHRSKFAAEALLVDAATQGGPTVRIIRMSRCFPEPAPVMAVYRLHRGIDARDVATAHVAALAHEGPAAARYVVSGDTPFMPEDCIALAHDAAAVLARRAPQLVAACAARAWPLPARIDRVYVNHRARADLGWVPRHGWEDVLRQYDEMSSEVLPPHATAAGND
jgi:nucleoside-diphosphate-sugar epimerase